MSREPWSSLIQSIVVDAYQEEVLAQHIDELDTPSPCGSFPIHFAVLRDIETLQFLLMNNVNVNQRNKYGETALHWAVKAGNALAVRYLINEGIDVNQQDGEQNSALHWAAEYNEYLITQLLLTAGGCTTQKNRKGFTPKKVASIFKSKETKRILMDL